MKLWELIKICSDGGYIEGDKFINEDGFILNFDGVNLITHAFLDVNSTWKYLEREVK